MKCLSILDRMWTFTYMWSLERYACQFLDGHNQLAHSRLVMVTMLGPLKWCTNQLLFDWHILIQWKSGIPQKIKIDINKAIPTQELCIVNQWLTNDWEFFGSSLKRGMEISDIFCWFCRQCTIALNSMSNMPMSLLKSSTRGSSSLSIDWFEIGNHNIQLGLVHTMAKLREEKRFDQWKCINAQNSSSRPSH